MFFNVFILIDDKVTVSEQKDLIADTEQFLNGEVENV